MAIQRINLGTAPSGTGGDTNRTAFKKIDDNFADSANAASRLVGTATGNVMEVGAFGVGVASNSPYIDYDKDITGLQNGFYGLENGAHAGLLARQTGGSGTNRLCVLGLPADPNNKNPFFYIIDLASGKKTLRDNASNKYIFYSTANTIVDGNGVIKAASPVVRLFADKIELNNEAKLQDIIFEKLGVGDYLIKGSLGFAQEGWYIETPRDANGNVLFAVVYEQLDNNDISVKTYDYMLNKKGRIVPDLETPLDIPETRWIDLRLQALPQTTPLSKDETVNTNAQ